MAVFAKLAYAAGADPAGLLIVRFGGAALVLAAAVAVTRPARPARRDLLFLAGLGVVYVCQALSFLTAVARIPAGLAAVLLYTYPILVAAAAALFLRQRPTRRQLGAMAAATAGVVLVAAPAMSRDAAGIALALAAAVFYTGYLVLGAGVTARVPAMVATAVVCVVAFAGNAGLGAAAGASFPRTTGGWLAVIAIALVSTIVALAAMFAGLRLQGPTTAATVSTFEPVVTVALAYVVFGETLSPAQLGGGVLVLAAVTLLTLAPGSHAAAPARPEVPAERAGAPAAQEAAPGPRPGSGPPSPEAEPGRAS
ncbi:EamA/RhaT family transporter [Bailinhaonella thermotolerans]|uniref:EamA/RhaT family transporter n=2 Tax=Bailinhaonella thermotolerans TaxID=1070861 RepID=A0A3A4B4H7_9ACTN|nr:EamA/RhaT family transporter [Bailinhaonella thermotolerans]